MNYIKFSIDANGLYNNGLHVYKRTNNKGSTSSVLLPAGSADFVITDAPLSASEQLNADNILKASKDITPKQLNNIIFFEQLKAFRR